MSFLKRKNEYVWAKKQCTILLEIMETTTDDVNGNKEGNGGGSGKSSRKIRFDTNMRFGGRKGNPLIHSIIKGYFGSKPDEETQSWKCVEKLVSMGCNVNALDEENRTPVMVAARTSHIFSLKLLLNLPGDTLNLSAVDRSGNSVLSYAVQSGSYPIVRAVAHRLSPETFTELFNLSNSTGKTPFQLSAEQKKRAADITVMLSKLKTKADIKLHPELVRFSDDESSTTSLTNFGSASNNGPHHQNNNNNNNNNNGNQNGGDSITTTNGKNNEHLKEEGNTAGSPSTSSLKLRLLRALKKRKES